MRLRPEADETEIKTKTDYYETDTKKVVWRP